VQSLGRLITKLLKFLGAKEGARSDEGVVYEVRFNSPGHYGSRCALLGLSLGISRSAQD